jgi:outer membrane receptor protein involved in Fe transport
MSWIKGRHTLAFGGEYRLLTYPNESQANGSGTFNFYGGPTSMLGQQSGYSMASFLLGTVSSASVSYYGLPSYWPKAWAVGAFLQDTFKATNKLTVTYGARWDRYTPSYEGNNKMSFFDPTRPNPGANGLPPLAHASPRSNTTKHLPLVSASPIRSIQRPRFAPGTAFSLCRISTLAGTQV